MPGATPEATVTEARQAMERGDWEGLALRHGHRRLVQRLRLPDAAVGFGFTHLARGETPPGLAAGRLLRVRRGA